MADVAERKGVKKKERKNLIRWSRILLTLSLVYPDSFFSLYPPKK